MKVGWQMVYYFAVYKPSQNKLPLLPIYIMLAIITHAGFA
jgi:hypothetical protein